MGTIPESAVWAIFFLPLAAFITIGVVIYPWRRQSGWVGIFAIALSFVLSLWALNSVIANHGHDIGYSNHIWVAFFNFAFSIGITLDGLSGLMLVVVTGVSLMVHIYSQGYMHGDEGYSRYFAYLSLFTASMLGLIISRNLLMVFIFWELVGLSSYLLIGFWFNRPAAAAAAKKAFLTTRLGDLGFLIAIIVIWTQTSAVIPADSQLMIPAIIDVARAGALTSIVLTWFTLGIFAGAVGKSAQFPLHVWLPDAMEGPTPVSALIHAATMVAAGVYLVARLFPVFELAPDTLQLIAFIGGLTAIGAAAIGLVMTDIKRVLAYSTISQLGYMMLALGVGGLTAAIFHLFTHAFFKALLFLGSGSVNHATNTFDMRLMGGLRRYMPITFSTFVIGSLSLAGIPPFAGFFSKDEILLDSFTNSPILFWVALITAGMTAFYMGRVIFMTFFGEYKGGEKPAHGEEHQDESAHGSHASHAPHESPLTMALPLIILAVPAIIAGFANVGGGITHLLEGTLPEDMERHHAEFNMGIAALSTVVAASGIILSWLIYHRKVISSEALYRFFEPIPTALNNKYYLDTIYQDILVRGVFYNGIARFAAAFDSYVVDGVVNNIGRSVRLFGDKARRVQTGDLQAYAAVFVGGIIVILGVIFLSGRI